MATILQDYASALLSDPMVTHDYTNTFSDSLQLVDSMNHHHEFSATSSLPTSPTNHLVRTRSASWSPPQNRPCPSPRRLFSPTLSKQPLNQDELLRKQVTL